MLLLSAWILYSNRSLCIGFFRKPRFVCWENISVTVHQKHSMIDWGRWKDIWWWSATFLKNAMSSSQYNAVIDDTSFFIVLNKPSHITMISTNWLVVLQTQKKSTPQSASQEEEVSWDIKGEANTDSSKNPNERNMLCFV